MDEMDENQALAIMFGNTKRKKRNVDLITLAKSCEILVKRYGSRKEVGEILGLSAEMIRQILTPLKVSDEVKKLISEKKIDSIDLVMHLSSIKDQNLQTKAALMLTNFHTKDVRDILQLIKKSGIDIEKAIDTIIENKPKGVHILMLDLDDHNYILLKNASEKIQMPPAILAKFVLQCWLKNSRWD